MKWKGAGFGFTCSEISKLVHPNRKEQESKVRTFAANDAQSDENIPLAALIQDERHLALILLNLF